MDEIAYAFFLAYGMTEEDEELDVLLNSDEYTCEDQILSTLLDWT